MSDEYPKMLHKGEEVDPNAYNHENLEILIVGNGDEEGAARKDGYASLHELAAPVQKEAKNPKAPKAKARAKKTAEPEAAATEEPVSEEAEAEA